MPGPSRIQQGMQTSFLSTVRCPLLACCLMIWLAACGARPTPEGPSQSIEPLSTTAPDRAPEHDGTPLAPALAAGQSEAVFAGGCFWCMERPFEQLDGVLTVESGYTGGSRAHPSYREVSAGVTGHYEAVRIVYDPSRVSYARLLEVFFRNVDPTQSNGQFCDRGTQYRSGIFVRDASERVAAEAAVAETERILGRRVVTQVLDAAPFYVAEAYHQDYYRTHPAEYAAYRHGCGRDARLRELWGEAAGHGGDGVR